MSVFWEAALVDRHRLDVSTATVRNELARLEEDGYITHVGPGTPAGEYLRRFWHPVAYESELTDVPLALTILGEELVVYRDGNGRVGCLELHCPHRGTSLEFGIVEQ
ncbi:MAG: Rieske 2Fe-2S domain-containing protein, partial [Acidobacteria bacterium]|nr:Rieske 2Fe-2S domain-containing protein [Acidobacteriota bacterium]